MLTTSLLRSLTAGSKLARLRREHRRIQFKKQATRRWAVERLEDRALLSTFVVNTVSDLDLASGLPVGQKSLRQAIEDANGDTSSEVDTIDFNIPGSGVQTLQPLSQLPIVTHPVLIDGYSQPGSSPNTLAVGDNAVLLIELEGSLAGDASALHIMATDVTVQGLDINNFAFTGIWLDAPGGDTVQGCFIGTDPTGETALIDNVYVTSDSNLIGTNGDGTNDFAERNVVSNTGVVGFTTANIYIAGNSNVVAGNYVGTDATGTKDLTGQAVNISGVFVDDGSFNRIGVDGHDPDPSAEANVISGNFGGVGLQGGGQNVVAGNLIGTDATGTKPLGNTQGVNIYVSNGNLIGTNGDGVGDSYERNIISGNSSDGVVITYSNDNTIAGNYIGSSATGETGVANGGGIFVFAGVANTIGGLTADDSNLICDNGTGIAFNGGSTDTQNVVEGNNIGFNPVGLSPAGNGEGVSLSGVGNTIGGTSPGAGNSISGNHIGLDINSGAADNVVQGNVIGGLYVNGQNNGNDLTPANFVDGVLIEGGSQANTIGGTAQGAGNTIAGNNIFDWSTGGGVVVVGATTVGNTIRGNSIFDNSGLGIDLGADGVTPDTPGGPHIGPNDLQNYPILTTAKPGSTEVIGTLNAAAGTMFTIDFYANDNDKGSAQSNGQGQYYLGSTTVITDSSGNASFDDSNLAATTVGEWISATATDPSGNTSEFSLDIPATVPSSIVLTTSSDTQTYWLAAVTATVAGPNPADGTPTGTVQLVVDGVTVGSPAPLYTGTAFIPVESAVGTYTVTAIYSGDSSFQPSTSASLPLQITPAPLTIVAKTPYKIFGSLFTFTGTEFDAGPLYNNDQVSSVTLASAGAAPTAPVAGSPYAIVPSAAIGTGLSNYDITYVDGSLTVYPNGTSVTLSASTTAPLAGQPVVLTATVSPTSPSVVPPTGVVTFYDGDSELGTAFLSGSGGTATAVLTTASLAAGIHSVTAFYGGDGDFTGSSSRTLTSVVGIYTPGGGYSGDGGSATAAALNGPLGLAFDSAGDLFIADGNNNVIREVMSDGTIVTVAGNGTAGYSGDGGAATAASLNLSGLAGFSGLGGGGLAIDAAGDLFIADTTNNVVREVRPDGIITTVAGNGTPGYAGDGGPATAAELDFPSGVAVDAHGDLFIADAYNNVIREVMPDGIISTVVGGGSVGVTDGIPATAAAINLPTDVAVDSQGNLFIADAGDGVVLEVPADGVISVAAYPVNQYTVPTYVTLDASGNIYYSDQEDNGVVEFSPDGSFVTNVRPVLTPTGLAVDSAGDLFIAVDYSNQILEYVGTECQVQPVTPASLQSALSASQQGGSAAAVTLQTTSSSSVTTAVQAITSITNPSPATPDTVTLDLSGATTSPAAAINVPAGVQLDLTSSSGTGTMQGVTVSGGTVTIAASVSPVDWTVNGGNVLVQGSASAGDFIVNGGTVTLADGTVITGNSPAITVNGGTVILQGVTAQTATSSPTILVNGGSLVVRDSMIEESTGYAQAAILINGGTVDLGTTASPGGNTFNVNGAGTLIENTTSSPVPAVGDRFENNSAVVASNFGTVSLSTPPAQTANQGVTQPFNLGSLTDTLNDSQSWTVDINWGDGSIHTDLSATAIGPLGTQSHAFALPGAYMVTVTATDPLATGVTAWDFVQTFTVSVAPSIFVLDPSAGGALSLSGNASLKIPGAVVVDSSSKTAISASGNAQVKASVIDVRGGVQDSGNASFSPAPTTGAATLTDPLASLAEPSTSGLTSYGSETLSGNSSAKINPGVYSQISVSGNGTLILNSGTYIIEGGGFSVSGNASVSGSGVMIVNAGSKYPSTGGTSGSITLSGNGSYNLSPPTSGIYAGIVIFQTRDNTKALTLSGNALGMTGTVYAPAAQLAESGNAALNAAVIVDTLTISGNGINNALSLNAPTGTVAYTPNQIRDAYGINNLSWDGTGQTIAIVDAYDDPNIDQALDAFDTQFTLTDSGPTLYNQYGPASSFLTVLNQYGQATSLPSADPNGPGTDNWEVEEALDVEWTHAIAPGAQIILVEANSQALSDLMASVATAASQPGVSVVSMSWGFAEGQAVFASDEATYDSTFNVPGVTFVASTGDYGAADPEYPAFSPNVVAVGGTSLTLNANNSYNSETGWGYQSNSVGAFIGSGGGMSLYEPEPAYQQGVQSTGSRTTPDVSLVADPATGAWIADTYNLDPSNPFEIVGGTSLSAPAWAGLLALVNQGRAAAGGSTLNSSTPTDTQQALYMLPQSDYNTIASGTNGYSAGAGYNLVTGLGTPVANLLVPDLIAYQGSGTTYSGPTVGPLQNASLVNTGASSGGPIDVFSVFDSITLTSTGLGSSDKTPAPSVPDRTVTAQDVSIPDSSVGADPLAAVEFRVSTPALVIPDSGIAAVDAVLIGWSPTSTAVARGSVAPGGAAPARPVTVSGSSPGLVWGSSRMLVLDADSVDTLLGKKQKLGTLFDS